MQFPGNLPEHPSNDMDIYAGKMIQHFICSKSLSDYMSNTKL